MVKFSTVKVGSFRDGYSRILNYGLLGTTITTIGKGLERLWEKGKVYVLLGFYIFKKKFQDKK